MLPMMSSKEAMPARADQQVLVHAGNGEFHQELQVHRPSSADDVE